MSEGDVQQQLVEAHETIRALQEELAETNRGLVALTLELEQRVDERTRELRAAHVELQKTNANLLQLMFKLQTSNQELETFSYSVSHDLRTPLQSILAFSELLSRNCADRLDAQGTHYLQRLQSGCQRMAQLIDDMLMLSRVTRSEMRQEAVDLSTMAKSIAGTLVLTDPQRRAEFIIAEGVVATGDKGLLRVVLENLLGNAWKYTNKQSHACIEFGCTEPPPTYFVRDNGVGFDMADADKLFSPFRRLHTASEFPGTGIGLATVQRIIQRHGGRIWAEAVVGQGATFYFSLSRQTS